MAFKFSVQRGDLVQRVEEDLELRFLVRKMILVLDLGLVWAGIAGSLIRVTVRGLLGQFSESSIQRFWQVIEDVCLTELFIVVDEGGVVI